VGTIATGRFAGRCPDLVERLVFFGPVTWRQKKAEPQTFPAWRVVSLKDQWDRFTAEVPPGEPGVLSKSHFEGWGSLYLDTDPASRSRSPASVKTPSGPWQDIADSGAGDLAYDPGLIRAPVAIVRGEWDSLATDADARWLFDALKASPMKTRCEDRTRHPSHAPRRKPLRALPRGADLSGRLRPPTCASLARHAAIPGVAPMFAVMFVVQPKRVAWTTT